MTAPEIPQCKCGDDLKRRFAEMDTDTNVSPWRLGMTAYPYDDLGLRCRHGVRWHAEPTSEQRLQWARDGVL